MEAMRAFEDFSLEAVGRAQRFVDFGDTRKTLAAGVDGKNVVLRAGLGEQWTRRDKARDVVHLGPVQDAGHVVVDAVRQAENAVAERVEIAADHGGFDARFERSGECGASAAAGNSHAAYMRR